jgi:hypothetical protein
MNSRGLTHTAVHEDKHQATLQFLTVLVVEGMGSARPERGKGGSEQRPRGGADRDAEELGEARPRRGRAPSLVVETEGTAASRDGEEEEEA